MQRLFGFQVVKRVYFTPKEMEPVWSPAWGVPALVPGRPWRPGRRGCSQCLSLQVARPEV